MPSPSRTNVAIPPRRAFLADLGLGFTGLALGAMFARDGLGSPADWTPPDGSPHFAPKAKHVIWLFMNGGVSHLESFDYKPEITKHAGKTIAETPYADVQNPAKLALERAPVPDANGLQRNVLFPLQTGFRRHGQSGMEISDFFPHTARNADRIAVVRSMWTTDNNHGAQLQFHTGRHVLEGQFPTIGSWIHYGLGTLNENLPQFVVMGRPIADCCGGVGAHGANYLGPEHQGVQLEIDPKKPLPYAGPGADVFTEEQEAQFALMGRLNRFSALEYPEDTALAARIKSYELAFRMQMAVPEVVAFNEESESTRRLYGLDQSTTKSFGQQCLAARRLVERGVRFIQIFHGGNGGAGEWDAHGDLRNGHSKLCGQVDRPIGGLLKDLKQRGLLDETLVVWGTEFGRTPGAQGTDGRDQHPYGFSVWLAGGGIRGGIAHGATDELGFHAVEDRHYITDLHATVLHQLGLNSERLTIPGRQRLAIDFGEPIHGIIS